VLHPGLKIRRVAWPRGIQGTGKQYSSLQVFLTSPEMANQVIRRGFAVGGEVKDAERFQTGCGLVQCFKCCGYGYIAKNCRLNPHCGHCSEDHETRDCSKTERSICAICAIQKRRCNCSHKAWSELCPVQADTREMLRERLRSAPHLYALDVPEDRRPVVTELPLPKRGRPVGSTNKKPNPLKEGVGTSTERMDLDVESRGPKRKCQSTLAFRAEEVNSRESAEE
jgi:hypothetical protein